MKNSLANSSEARPLQLDRLRKQKVCCSYHPSIFKTTFFHMVSDGQLSWVEIVLKIFKVTLRQSSLS
jgi:hypothetical protein